MKAKLVLRGIAAGITALSVVPVLYIALYALAENDLVGFQIAAGVAGGLVYLTIRLLDAPEYPLAQQLKDLPRDVCLRYRGRLGGPLAGGDSRVEDLRMVPAAGIEPATRSLQNCCSTD